MKRESDVLACCTTAYSHPAAQWLRGDSFHPGGLALTAELANLCGIDAGSRVLDAGSGPGTSAVHLAKTTGCRVAGITLEQEGVTTGRELARQHEVEERVVFFQADIQEAELALESFDVALMECVLSILPDKAATLRRLNDLLRPGVHLGLTDVTVNGVLPPELHSVLATVGCVGDALSLPEYSTLLEESDFAIQRAQDLPEVASTFLKRRWDSCSMRSLFDSSDQEEFIANRRYEMMGGSLLSQVETAGSV